MAAFFNTRRRARSLAISLVSEGSEPQPEMVVMASGVEDIIETVLPTCLDRHRNHYLWHASNPASPDRPTLASLCNVPLICPPFD